PGLTWPTEANVDAIQTLLELFGRIPEHVTEAVDGLTAEELTTAPEPGSNTIGWQVWHLTRVQDEHITELLDGQQQIWVTEPWPERFGLTPDPANTGFGHTADEVMKVRPDGPDALVGY